MTDAQGWPDPETPGVPLNPERDGWHWLQHRIESKPVPHVWVAEIEAWSSGAAYSPEGVVELGWRYLGPCLTPAEVTALVVAARREEREACASEADKVASGLIVNGKNYEAGYANGALDVARVIRARGGA